MQHESESATDVIFPCGMYVVILMSFARHFSRNTVKVLGIKLRPGASDLELNRFSQQISVFVSGP